MDNTMHDNLGVEDVQKAGAAVKGIVNKLIWRRKVKQAQAISDAGGYMTLTAHQKGMIAMPAYAHKHAVDQKVPVKVIEESPPIPASEGQVLGKLKAYLPYIIGAIILMFGFYYISKKS